MKALCSFMVVALACTILLMGIGDTRGFWVEGTRITSSGAGMSSSSYRGDTLKIAGSRIPDCMHACGPCSPCRLVMVRFNCGVVPSEAETCPMSYRCMCSNKAYHVP